MLKITINCICWLYSYVNNLVHVCTAVLHLMYLLTTLLNHTASCIGNKPVTCKGLGMQSMLIVYYVMADCSGCP